MSAGLPALVVFYDGECGLCAAVLAWALRRDRGSRLRPVPAQSEEARALLEPRDAALIHAHAPGGSDSDPGSSGLLSTTIASVVSTIAPMLAAFWSAQRTTLAGSMMPASSRSR